MQQVNYYDDEYFHDMPPLSVADLQSDLFDVVSTTDSIETIDALYPLNNITIYTLDKEECDKETFECPLCMEDVSNRQKVELNCQHTCCASCLTECFRVSQQSYRPMRCFMCRNTCFSVEIPHKHTFETTVAKRDQLQSSFVEEDDQYIVTQPTRNRSLRLYNYYVYRQDPGSSDEEDYRELDPFVDDFRND